MAASKLASLLNTIAYNLLRAADLWPLYLEFEFRRAEFAEDGFFQFVGGHRGDVFAENYEDEVVRLIRNQIQADDFKYAAADSVADDRGFVDFLAHHDCGAIAFDPRIVRKFQCAKRPAHHLALPVDKPHAAMTMKPMRAT
jgi:hypothetical protein